MRIVHLIYYYKPDTHYIVARAHSGARQYIKIGWPSSRCLSGPVTILFNQPPPPQLIGGEKQKPKCVDDNPTVARSIVDYAAQMGPKATNGWDRSAGRETSSRAKRHLWSTCTARGFTCSTCSQTWSTCSQRSGPTDDLRDMSRGPAPIPCVWKLPQKATKQMERAALST